MADDRPDQTNDPAAQTQRSAAASGDGAGSSQRQQPPRPAVSETSEGYPEVDSLSFDPEDRDWLTLSRRWIEENPALAMLGAAAAGLLLGRIVAAAIPEPEPQTFAERVEERARELAKQGRSAAGDASDVAGRQLAIAAEALGEASKALGQGAKRGLTEAKDFGEFLADNIGKAVADRASKWLDR